MNKEYMYLNNYELAVTDEFGHIDIRKIHGNDKEILLFENKVENINNIISDLEMNLLKPKNKQDNFGVFKKSGVIMAIVFFGIYIISIPIGSSLFALGYSIFHVIFANVMKSFEKKSK